MKNKTYIVGIVTVFIITSGCLFKIMHWPTAGLQIIVGILLASLVFLPLAFASSFKNEQNKKLKPLYVLTQLVFSLNLISALFKIMHWPYSDLLLIITIPLPFVVVLPAFLYYNKKEEEINYKSFMPIMFFFAYFAAISALLALNVSKGLIDEYCNSANAISIKTELLTQECNALFEKTKADTSINAKTKAIILAIHEKDEQIQTLINNLKIAMVDQAEGNGLQAFANKQLNVAFMRNMDRGVILAPAPAIEIAKRVQELKILITDFQANKTSLNHISQILPDYQNEESYKFMYHNDLLIASINDLCMLQYQLQLAEYFIIYK